MKKIFGTLMLMSGVMLVAERVDAQSPHAYNTTAAAPVAASPEKTPADEFFEQVDTNKDGLISKDEMVAFERKRIDKDFSERDLNKDGYLSQDELMTFEQNKNAQRRVEMEKRRAEMEAKYKAMQEATDPNPNDFVNPDPAGLGDLNNNNGPLGEAVPGSVTGNPGM